MMRNRRILIVDDEPYNILGMQIVLEQSGFKGMKHLIDTAHNGEIAYNLIKKAFSEKQFSYGLILMDCSMPVMDGYEASDLIRDFARKNYIYQPMIVACTGHTEDEYI